MKIKTALSILAIATSLFAFESKYLPGYDIQTKCDQVLHKRAYDTCYSYKWKTPKLAVYKIDGEKLKSSSHYSRKGLTFKPDYSIKTRHRSYTRDYSRTGFDRGHLAENGSFNYDKVFQKETFKTSNIAPEKPNLNRGVWARIEKFSRIQAIRNKSVSVITGVCGTLGHIKNSVNIPRYWYKIIFKPDGQQIAFLAPNTNNIKRDAKMRYFLVPISKIEEQCNLQFVKNN